MAGEAQFSGFMDALLAKDALTGAFTIKRREVNVLREQEFPLLAVWVDRSGIAESAGDDESRHETVYAAIVAARLGDGEAQDEALGRLLKIVFDTAETIAQAGVDFEVGEWNTDSGAAEDEGSKVWAEFSITLDYQRPRGNL